jgi:23S rRNA (cytidine1920-2'-O)/16S rRNA (cytidine1409-2'-O)-methyltransferase
MALVERGFAQSRSRARDMVARGCVCLNGALAEKASTKVQDGDTLSVDDEASRYVSRAALKLLAALDVSKFEIDGAKALDLGASTGGFTQVLLERGAATVIAVDVGHGQMASEIADNPRVQLLEKTNARDLTAALIGAPEVVVCDVSFISLRIAADPPLTLAAPGARAMLLVKPQFEVGRDGIGKNGVVTDEALIAETCASLRVWFDALPGWSHTHFLPSPVLGGDGNREFLLCGVKA